MSDPNQLVESLLNADRAYRDARRALAELSDNDGVLRALTARVETLLKAEPGDEVSDQLMCLAETVGESDSADAAKLLARLLDHADPAVRQTAGESLIEALYDRYGEVARILEAEVDKGTATLALMEIPFLFAEVGEPGGTKIVTKLLKHGNADVVAAAIDALARFEDPQVVKQLEPLKKDKRKVTTDDPDGQNEVTVGELATEVIGHLRSLRDG